MSVPAGTAPEFAWLVERGQPEGQRPTVWLRLTTSGLVSEGYGDWVEDASQATRFPSKEAAELVVEEHFCPPLSRPPTARAVEHGFGFGAVSAAPERDDAQVVLSVIERVDDYGPYCGWCDRYIEYGHDADCEAASCREALARLVADLDAAERLKEEVLTLDTLLAIVDAALKREAREDDPEWVGYYGMAVGPWHKVLAQRHHVTAAVGGGSQAHASLQARLVAAERERDAQRYRADQHLEAWVTSSVGKLQARLVEAELHGARAEARALAAEKALREIAEFCESHLPFASDKSEIVARRVGERARAALEARVDSPQRFGGHVEGCEFTTETGWVCGPDCEARVDS